MPKAIKTIPSSELIKEKIGINNLEFYLSLINKAQGTEYTKDELTGPQGPQGLKGDLGGPQGPLGPQGFKGNDGSTGLMGSKGDKGDTGPQGEDGPQGIAGGSGILGPQGFKGSIGPQGLGGNIGPQGNIGLLGPQGPQGTHPPSLEELDNDFTINGFLKVRDSLSINTNKFTVEHTTGNTSIDGNLNIKDKFLVNSENGNTEIDGNLNINNKFTVDSLTGNTNLSGNININDKFTVDSQTGNTNIEGIVNIKKNTIIYENLGIGTGSESLNNPLSVISNDSQQILIKNNSTNSHIGHPAEIIFKKLVNQKYEASVGVDYSPKNFYIRYNGAERFNISDSGNIGIGTNTPSFKLDVKGDFCTQGSIYTMPSSIIDNSIWGKNGSIQLVNMDDSPSPSVLGQVTEDNCIGLSLVSGSSDTNNQYDMMFDIRRKDNRNFSINTGAGFCWSINKVVKMDLSRAGDLVLKGNANINGNLDLGGTLNMNSDMTFTKLLNVNGGLKCNENKFTLSTSGDIATLGTMDVNGITKLNSLLKANGGIECNVNKFTVSTNGDTSISGTANITGNTTVSGLLKPNGGIQLNTDKFTVDNNGDTVIDGILTLNKQLTTNQIINADGGIVCKNDKFIVLDNGNTTIGGTVEIKQQLTCKEIVQLENDFKCNTNKVIITSTNGNIYSDGKLGIGVQNPLYRLHIDDNSNKLALFQNHDILSNNTVSISLGKDILTDNNSGEITYGFKGDNNPDNYLSLGFNNNSNKLVLKSSGKVGLGKTDPQYDLDVVGDINITGNYKINGTDISFAAASAHELIDTDSDTKITVQEDNNIKFYTSGSERMIINNNGNVGIGTTDPRTNLQLGNYFTLDGGRPGDTDYGDYMGVLGFNRDIYNGDILNSSYSAFQLENYKGNLNFLVFDGDGSGANIENALVISGTGNIGMGTSNPLSCLHIQGPKQGSPGAEGIHIGRDGAVTGGGNNDNYGIELCKGTGDENYIDFTEVGTDYKGRIGYDYTNNEFIFTVNSSKSMILDSNGNVGIGVTDPQSKLEVSGNIFLKGNYNNGLYVGDTNWSFKLQNIDNDKYYSQVSGWWDEGNKKGFRLYNSSNDSVPFFVNSTGNVGIGTVDPYKKLEILNNVNYGSWTNVDPGVMLKLSNPNNSYAMAGIGFCVDNTGLNSDSYKGAISMQRTNSYGLGDFVFYLNNSSDSTNVTTDDEVFRITKDGKVGIENGTPKTSLQIGDNFCLDKGGGDFMGLIGFNRDTRTGEIFNTSYGAFQIQNYQGNLIHGVYNSQGDSVNGYALVISDTGNIGIGTITPGQAFSLDLGEINNDSHKKFYMEYSGEGAVSTAPSGGLGGTTGFQTNCPFQLRKNDYGQYGINLEMGHFSDNGNAYIQCQATNTGARDILLQPYAGYVGIGTNNPSYPLHVYRSTAGQITSNYGWLRANGDAVGFFGGTNQDGWNYSIYSSRSILCAQEIHVISDKRIKKNIEELNDNEALLKFRQLKPCKYSYIDQINRGNDIVYGFIAQEVKEVLPYGSNIISSKEYVPNLYKNALHNNNIISFDKEHNLDSDGNIKLILHNNKEIIVPYKIVDTLKISIDTSNLSDDEKPINGLIEDDEGNYLIHNVFVYGTEVNDFHTLNKNAIWTVAAAALQEVDRIQQADAVKIQTLENKVSILETKNSELESQLTDVLNRLSALEKNN